METLHIEPYYFTASSGALDSRKRYLRQQQDFPEITFPDADKVAVGILIADFSDPHLYVGGMTIHRWERFEVPLPSYKGLVV